MQHGRPRVESLACMLPRRERGPTSTALEAKMRDDKKKGRHQRISTQPHELRAWSQRLGVTPEDVRRAIAEVGDDAEKVERHLRTNRPKGPETA
jgi:hypothetical protein